MLDLAIIGTGNIGSRHLQALAFLEEPARIVLVDPSRENRAIATERLEAVEAPNRALELDIEQRDRLPAGRAFDLAIVATSSAVRAAAVRELVAGCTVENLVLEKFLFQRRDDYASIGRLLQDRRIPTWVNHWITDTYAFRRAAARVLRQRPFTMQVSGEGWGLCCNAVHYLEFFDHLTGRGEMDCREATFEPEVIASKRAGYFEINGSMTFASERGDELVLECRGDNVNFAAIEIAIRAAGNEVRMVMQFGRLECAFSIDGEAFSEVLVLHPQSRRSQQWIHELMLEGRCGLPTYERSTYQHMLVFDRFADHFERNGVAPNGTCPVT